MGGLLGLDWPSVKIILDAAGLKITPDLMRKLLTLEGDALPVLVKRSAANND